MEIVRINKSYEEQNYKDKLLIVKVNAPKRGLIERLLDPVHTLQQVYIEQQGGEYKVVLILNKHSLFGVRSVKRYVEACFPGGDSYWWTTESEEEAIETANKYKERLGTVVYV